MNTIHSFKVLREIKREHGLPETTPLAAWLSELVLTYNESYSKFAVIAHTQANIYTQKVRHDSFSEALNRTILNLETLINNDCFPSSNHEHSNLSTAHENCQRPPSQQTGSSANHAIIYRHSPVRNSTSRLMKGRSNKKQIKQSRKCWGSLIQDCLLLDLYKTYVAETGDRQLKPGIGTQPSAHAFINRILQHITHSTTPPSMRIHPTIPPLPSKDFRSIVKRYRALSG